MVDTGIVTGALTKPTQPLSLGLWLTLLGPQSRFGVKLLGI